VSEPNKRGNLPGLRSGRVVADHGGRLLGGGGRLAGIGRYCYFFSAGRGMFALTVVAVGPPSMAIEHLYSSVWGGDRRHRHSRHARTMQCGWPPTTAPNVPQGTACLLLGMTMIMHVPCPTLAIDV